MSTSYRPCVCEDWRVNLPILNAPLMSAFARNPNAGHGYKGKPFHFCPWCATSLRVVTTETVLPDATVTQPQTIACSECHGCGQVEGDGLVDTPVECPTCDGTGKLRVPEVRKPPAKVCLRCGGTGEIPLGGYTGDVESCPACGKEKA